MQKLAVVMGGYSDEYVISLKSGELIFNSIDLEKYIPYRLHILKEGWFVLVDEEKIPINKSDFSFEHQGKTIQFDLVYNTIHGTPGEDGHMQAYWELINMPYSGARYYQSALTFNKRDTLSVLKKFGVNTADSLYFTKGDEINFQDISKELGLPFFVKPNKSGSSLGVSKVHEESQFQEALNKAFLEDKDILIERMLKGREISIGVCTLSGKPTALGVTEILSENDFFDYEAKYHGKSKEVTPADLDKDTYQNVMQTAEYIYSKLDMTGFSRLDFILENEVPFFIEINTNPGMSPASIFPQQVEHSPYTMKELLNNELELAQKYTVLWKE